MTSVAVGGIWHETNTFAPGTTGVDDFAGYQLADPDDLVERYEGVRNEVGGFLTGAAKAGLTVRPTLFAAAVPSGIVEAEAFAELRRRLLAGLDPKSDGVLLALHGAMVVEGIDDPELDLVEAVRAQLDRSVPVVITVDFHANLSQRLFEAVEMILGYDTYPHVDPWERGVEAAVAIEAIIEKGEVPAKAFRKLPLLTAPAAQETARQPMAAISALRAAAEDRPEVLAVTVAPGFPYADVPRAGFAVAAYATTQEAADAVAGGVADAVWQARHDFDSGAVPVDEAVRRACRAGRGPVVLVDVADNIGGGSPGDGTVVLRELLVQGARRAVVTIADPVAVEACRAAGPGAEVTLEVGGRTDELHGQPVELTALVRSMTDGRFTHKGSYMTGQVTDMGTTAVLEVGGPDGIDVVVSERKAMPFDAEQLRSQGIEPSERHIIVAKSAIAWRSAYGDLATDAIPLATPGVCTSELVTLPYRRVSRPILPLDPAVAWEPS